MTLCLVLFTVFFIGSDCSRSVVFSSPTDLFKSHIFATFTQLMIALAAMPLERAGLKLKQLVKFLLSAC